MSDADKTAPVAVVTGGAKRVGRAMCLRLADHGYRIAVHANTSIDEADALLPELEIRNTEAISLQANLTEESAARGMLDRAHEHFGQIDVLVNSAAIWSPKQLEQVTADDVRKNLEINTVASFVCAQHAGLIMAAQQQGGSIVNFGDIAMQHPQADYAAYHPSKGAIPSMTRSLAVELAHRNRLVRVNAILPGPVLISDDEPLERKQEVLEGPLVGTLGRAEHLAHAAMFLIENPFVTGVCLPMDGGRSIA